jgi:hypothetical protein
MITSRLRRVEDKRASKRILIAILGSVALLVFLLMFGLKILIGFGAMLDKIRGSSPQQQTVSDLLLPPILDSLPEATHSATISIRGKSEPKKEVIIYINDSEYKKVTTTDAGEFTIESIPVEETKITITAKLVGEKDQMSAASNVVTTVIDRTPPKLTVSKPEDNQTINDGSHKVTVEGMTDEGMRITVNDRIAVVKADGSFIYAMSVSDGETVLMIVSTDPAGNQTKVERRVTYQP